MSYIVRYKIVIEKEWRPGCHRQHYNIYDEPTGCPHSCGKMVDVQYRIPVVIPIIEPTPWEPWQPTDLEDFDF